MINTGSEFIQHLSQYSFDTNQLVWLLPRPSIRNQTFKIQGVMIAGELTNRIIGIALSKGINLIFLADYKMPIENIQLEKFGEILYKHDIFVLYWNWKWLLSSREGQAVIAKLLYTDYQKIYHNIPALTIQYERNIQIVKVLDRFDNCLYVSTSSRKLEDEKSSEIYLILEFTPHIITKLQNEQNKVIISTHLPECLDMVIRENQHIFIIIPKNNLFNEISRELYYIIKQNTYLQMDIGFNTPVKYEIIKN